jgi:3-mercaptopyruvate sulfurtransferase SseA
MAKLKSGCREDKLERSGGYLKSGETAARNLSCLKKLYYQNQKVYSGSTEN